MPQTQVVSIGDREADIYDIFVDAQQQTGRRADYVIRARVERCTKERNPQAGRNAYHRVQDKVRSAEILATRAIALPTTPKRAKREATLAVRAITVEVKPPHVRSSLPSVKLNVVLVEEVGGPGDGSDVSWLLITTLPIDTMAKALLVVDYYVARWSVEIYFKNLKSGCAVEKIQLETNSRLLNCLAFYNIIAWRVIYLTYLNRTCPELPCTTVFEDAEWKSVWCIVAKKKLPPKPPTLSEFMKLITALGGYNNRATEKAAGPLPVWIGLRRMLDFAIAWINFGPKDDVVYK